MLINTYLLSMNWGNVFADTKEVASIAVRPVFDNILISSTFSSKSTKFFSFYNPSLGLTSTILIFLGL